MKTRLTPLLLGLLMLPVAWQWKQRSLADNEVRHMRAQLLAAQTDSTNAQMELKRLRRNTTQLEKALARTNEAVALAADAAPAFAAWKEETRALLAATDYRWSDESPFVRISKTILPELNSLTKGAPFAPPGLVNPSARELLGLTSEERQLIEEILKRVAELQRGPPAAVYESDQPVRGPTLAARTFSAEPSGEVGPEAVERLTQMLEELHDILGEERWLAIPSRYGKADCGEWNRMLMPQPGSHITATIESDASGIPQVRWTMIGDATPPGRNDEVPTIPIGPAAKAPAGNTVYSVNVVGYVNGNAPLSAFLPYADSEQRERATNFGGTIHLPPAVKQRAVEWFQQQAAALLIGRVQP